MKGFYLVDSCSVDKLI